MGLNKHMMLEEHELEMEIEALRGYGKDAGTYVDGEWWAYEDARKPTRAELVRANKLERRLEELRKVPRDYNQFLGGV